MRHYASRGTSALILVAAVVALIWLAGSSLLSPKRAAVRPSAHVAASFDDTPAAPMPPPSFHASAHVDAASAPTYDAQEVRAVAWEYRDGKHNIFFKSGVFFADLLIRDPHAVAHFRAFVSDDEVLTTLSHDTQWQLDRMAAIDMLEGIATRQILGTAASEATQALGDLVEAPLAAHLPSAAKRVAVAERYDALAALVRLDPERAFALYAALPSGGLEQALKPAIMAGLVDLGVSRDHVMAMTQELRPPP